MYHITNAHESKSTDSQIEAIELYFEMVYVYDRYYDETLDQMVEDRVYPTLTRNDPETGEFDVMDIDELIFLCDEFWYGQEEELELYPRLEQAEAQIERIEAPIPF